MVQTVFSAALPVGEKIVVRKNRIVGAGRARPRLTLVTGLNGDEIEGQVVACWLARCIKEQASYLSGTVDIYPAVNPLGLSANEHGVPHVDIDLNRTFPGDSRGSITDTLAAAVFDDIEGSDMCIDVHSASPFFDEASQVSVEERSPRKVARLASLLNTDIVWVQPTGSVERSSLAHTLNEAGTPALVATVGTRRSVGNEPAKMLAEGVLRLLEELGGWDGPTMALPFPRAANSDGALPLRCETSGLFFPSVENCRSVEEGQELGVVADPVEGKVKARVSAPCSGFLFALRRHPMVYPGSLLASILKDER